MHNWLRSIKGGQFRLVNFASRFICVQIFQIDFLLILSASKYFIAMHSALNAQEHVAWVSAMQDDLKIHLVHQCL